MWSPKPSDMNMRRSARPASLRGGGPPSLAGPPSLPRPASPPLLTSCSGPLPQPLPLTHSNTGVLPYDPRCGSPAGIPSAKPGKDFGRRRFAPITAMHHNPWAQNGRSANCRRRQPNRSPLRPSRPFFPAFAASQPLRKKFSKACKGFLYILRRNGAGRREQSRFKPASTGRQK